MGIRGAGETRKRRRRKMDVRERKEKYEVKINGEYNIEEEQE